MDNLCPSAHATMRAMNTRDGPSQPMENPAPIHPLKATTMNPEVSAPVAPAAIALKPEVSNRPEPVWGCRSRFKSPDSRFGTVVRTERTPGEIPLECALKIKSAEFWLKLGDPTQALLEIQDLPEFLQTHPWPLKVRVAATGAIRELTAEQE